MEEILRYETIYFFPVDERIKQINNQHNLPGGAAYGRMSSKRNFGFDDHYQEYIIRFNEHLGYRYEVVKKLGAGSFGVVLRVFDHKEQEFVALKTLRNEKKLYDQGKVESGLLKSLNDDDPEDIKGIVRHLDAFRFRKHLTLTFEILGENLLEFIERNKNRGLSL